MNYKSSYLLITYFCITAFSCRTKTFNERSKVNVVSFDQKLKNQRVPAVFWTEANNTMLVKSLCAKAKQIDPSKGQDVKTACEGGNEKKLIESVKTNFKILLAENYAKQRELETKEPLAAQLLTVEQEIAKFEEKSNSTNTSDSQKNLIFKAISRLKFEKQELLTLLDTQRDRFALAQKKQSELDLLWKDFETLVAKNTYIRIPEPKMSEDFETWNTFLEIVWQAFDVANANQALEAKISKAPFWEIFQTKNVTFHFEQSVNFLSFFKRDSIDQSFERAFPQIVFGQKSANIMFPPDSKLVSGYHDYKKLNFNSFKPIFNSIDGLRVGSNYCIFRLPKVTEGGSNYLPKYAVLQQGILSGKYTHKAEPYFNPAIMVFQRTEPRFDNDTASSFTLNCGIFSEDSIPPLAVGIVGSIQNESPSWKTLFLENPITGAGDEIFNFGEFQEMLFPLGDKITIEGDKIDN